MNPVVMPELQEVMEAAPYRPAVSVILPIDIQINMQDELKHALKIAGDKVEKELYANYPHDLALKVMQKFSNATKSVEYNKVKKSIAVYVSPLFEKVLYLDIAVEEKIIVNETFEVRDLVYSKKQLHKYLVLLLSSKECRLFVGDGSELMRIKINIPSSVYAYINEAPERVANFSDTKERKETLMDKFLHHIDDALDNILNTYKLPLFVLGAEKLLGHFKSFSRHLNSVTEYVHGNYEEASMTELNKILQQPITELKKHKQNDLLKRLDEAAGKKKLSVGMKEVWQQALNKMGKLLVVEKNFTYPAEYGGADDKMVKAVEPYNKLPYVKDAVDDVIEMVLANGGDVEFVDEDVLKEYHRIALIEYY